MTSRRGTLPAVRCWSPMVLRFLPSLVTTLPWWSQVERIFIWKCAGPKLLRSDSAAIQSKLWSGFSRELRETVSVWKFALLNYVRNPLGKIKQWGNRVVPSPQLAQRLRRNPVPGGPTDTAAPEPSVLLLRLEFDSESKFRGFSQSSFKQTLDVNPD